jgi:hypothetical protein
MTKNHGTCGKSSIFRQAQIWTHLIYGEQTWFSAPPLIPGSFWRHAEAGAQLLSNTVQEQKSALTIGFTWANEANDGKMMIN